MNFDDVKTLFTGYDELVTIEDAGDFIVVKTKGFMKKDKWEELNVLAKEAGGKYVGGIGKNSHWRFSKEQKSAAGKVTQTKLVREAIDLMEKALTILRKAGY